jgi:hypothetical protein
LIHVPLHIKEQPVHSQMSVGQINLFPVFFHIQMNWNGMKYVLVALKSSSDSNHLGIGSTRLFRCIEILARMTYTMSLSAIKRSLSFVFCLQPILQSSKRPTCGQYASHQQLCSWVLLK